MPCAGHCPYLPHRAVGLKLSHRAEDPLPEAPWLSNPGFRGVGPYPLFSSTSSLSLRPIPSLPDVLQAPDLACNIFSVCALS